MTAKELNRKFRKETFTAGEKTMQSEISNMAYDV
jgi:hypothetical protein